MCKKTGKYRWNVIELLLDVLVWTMEHHVYRPVCFSFVDQSGNT